MRCPFCSNLETQVKDSRISDDGEAIKRRRYCTACDSRFTTYERVQLREILVIKKNGEKKILDKEYPSVWNQIEGAMAYMFDLPIMIIAQKGINDGLFENGTLPVFKNEYNLRSSHWIERQNFYEPFNEWFDRL